MSKKPDDTARIAGLAGILQAGNKTKEPPPSPAPPPDLLPTPLAGPARRATASPVGKSRDPNWHHYGVYLRKDTHKRAKRRLEDSESGKDMSELIQTLLEQWLASE